MPLLTHPAFGPRAALIYITAGALIDAWTGAWYWFFARDAGGNLSRNTAFWLTGLFLSGLILMIIGFFLGRIGRAARKAELPPTEATTAEAQIQQTSAAVPNPVVPVTGATAATPVMNPVAATVPGAPVPAPAAMPANAQPASPTYTPGVTRR